MKRSPAFQAMIQQLLLGQFEALERSLESADTLTAAEASEVRSLLEFQKGILHPPGELSVFETIGWYTLLQSRVATLVAQTLLVGFRLWLRFLGKDKAYFQQLYDELAPRICHYRYTNFAKCLIYCFYLRCFATEDSPHVENYFWGMFGHYLSLGGRFDRGIAIERQALARASGLARKTRPHSADPFHYMLFLDQHAAYLLDLVLMGENKSAERRFQRIQHFWKKNIYFWNEVFTRSIRLNASLEMLDDRKLFEDTQRLKTLLGDSFKGKYALRTSAFGALLSVIRHNYHSAHEQILSSEIYYGYPNVPVELARYHFLRALYELELGDSAAAIHHAHRARGYLRPVAGARYHQGESALLELEVKLRAFFIHPESLNFPELKRSALKTFRTLQRQIHGCKNMRVRIHLLRALVYYLDGRFAKSVKLLSQVHLDLAVVSRRSEKLLEQFNLSSCADSAPISARTNIQSKIEFSLLELISKTMSHDDVDQAGKRILQTIFGAEECKVVRLPRSESGSQNLYQIRLENQEQVCVALFLDDETLEFQILNPLNRINFDPRLENVLQFTFTLLRAIHTRRSAAKAEKMAALGKLAAQVAHDIRSPLTALSIVAEEISTMAEPQRILIRSAIARIRDIANSLLEQNPLERKLSVGVAAGAGEIEPVSTQLVPSVVDSIVSEKRIQYRSRLGVEISAASDPAAYGLFAQVQLSEFKRTLSNLINNSVEALGHSGHIEISLSGTAETIQIFIRDNGQGIPSDILERIVREGGSYQKPLGQGLGLRHAVERVRHWGGDLKIASTPGVGTEVTLALIRGEPPAWFVPELIVNATGDIVVLDDDVSIHQIWDRRLNHFFSPKKRPSVLHFSTIDEIESWLRGTYVTGQPVLFLIDYEILGDERNGLDVIREFRLQAHSILVTSRSEESSVLDTCLEHHIRLLPKGMAGIIPIRQSMSNDRPPRRRMISLHGARPSQMSL